MDGSNYSPMGEYFRVHSRSFAVPSFQPREVALSGQHCHLFDGDEIALSIRPDCPIPTVFMNHEWTRMDANIG